MTPKNTIGHKLPKTYAAWLRFMMKISQRGQKSNIKINHFWSSEIHEAQYRAYAWALKSYEKYHPKKRIKIVGNGPLTRFIREKLESYKEPTNESHSLKIYPKYYCKTRLTF